MTGLIRIRSVILLGGLHPHTFAIERDRHLQNITHTGRMERGGVSLVFYLLQSRIQRRLDRAAHSKAFQLHDVSTTANVNRAHQDVISA